MLFANLFLFVDESHLQSLSLCQNRIFPETCTSKNWQLRGQETMTNRSLRRSLAILCSKWAHKSVSVLQHNSSISISQQFSHSKTPFNISRKGVFCQWFLFYFNCLHGCARKNGNEGTEFLIILHRLSVK